jgi:hypothetical protein
VEPRSLSTLSGLCQPFLFALLCIHDLLLLLSASFDSPPSQFFGSSAPHQQQLRMGLNIFSTSRPLYTCDVYLIRYIEPDRFDLLEEVNVAPKTALKVIPAVRFPVQQKLCPGYLYTPPVICEPLFFFFF